MRVLVFFDLPTTTADERREYTKFRKYLIVNGFMMLQESVYSRLVLNYSVCEATIMALKNNSPNSGLVQVISITEKQYSRMEFIVGKEKNDVINDDRRLIVF